MAATLTVPAGTAGASPAAQIELRGLGKRGHHRAGAAGRYTWVPRLFGY